MKNKNTITLHIRYNEKCLYNIISILKNFLKTKPLTYDPGLQKEIPLPKTEILINLWRFYFKELYPILKNKYNKQETIKLIHLIFGNEISKYQRLPFTNACFFRVRISRIKENVQLYKNLDIIYIYDKEPQYYNDIRFLKKYKKEIKEEARLLHR